MELSIRGKALTTAPARAAHLVDPAVPERDPPIRYRESIPTSWLRLEITEGKNRQVRVSSHRRPKPRDLSDRRWDSCHLNLKPQAQGHVIGDGASAT